MIRPKAPEGLAVRCQRCGGNPYLEETLDGEEWRCLQCGRLVPVLQRIELPRRGLPAAAA